MVYLVQKFNFVFSEVFKKNIVGTKIHSIHQFTDAYLRKIPKSDCIYHFRMIWNQADVRLVPIQSENGK